MLSIIVCVLLGVGPSEDGSIEFNYESFEAGSGVTVDQLMPFYASLDADTIANIDPGVVPEGDS